MYKCRNCEKTFEELNKTGGCPFCGFYCSALTETKTIRTSENKFELSATDKQRLADWAEKQKN